MTPDLLLLAAALAGAGAFAGLIAGLFGVGGGIVIVPVLFHVFGAVGADDAVRMHAAVGTSLATIIVTAIRSSLAHNARGAVDWGVLRTWAPWIALGAGAGGLVARFVPGAGLTAIFGVGALIVAARMALAGEPKPREAALPDGPARAGLAGLLGFSSSWLGIGGGVFGVTILTLYGRPIHQAVGTAAAFGAAVGLPGAIGFMIAGWGAAGLPPYSLGYVNLPAFAFVAVMTTIFAPIGARLAHSLSRSMLRRSFAVLLGVVSLQMIAEALGVF